MAATPGSDPPSLEQAQDELRRTEARFNMALDHSEVRVFEHDLELRYTWIYNTQFYEVQRVIGRTDAELFAADDALRLMELKRRVLRTGERAKEEVHITQAGRRYDYLITVDPVRDAAGKIVGLTGASTNISATKEAQAELARSLEFRDLALAILGHDLRNPLAAIRTAAQLIARDPGLRDGSRRTLAIVERSVRRTSELIATLLDFADSRFHAAIPVSPAPMKLGDTVRWVVDELLAAHPERAIELEVRRDPTGRWDSARLAQVASNLLGNALKHGASGGTVRATVDVDGESSLLEVSNEGEPIPAHRLPHIFKPFQSPLRRGDTSPERGLGLGLYIAQEIVRAHAGSIDVRSGAPEGTTFSVRLPIERPQD